MIKNYAIIFSIYLITILSVLYFVFLYKNSSQLINYDSSINMLVIDSSGDYDKLVNNINNYIIEDDSFVVYYSSNNNINADLKRFIIDYNLDKEFLYIDNYKITNRLVKDYSNNQLFINQNDSLIYFSKGKISDIRACYSMNYDDFFDFFKKVGMI